jgi:hypothetical protein
MMPPFLNNTHWDKVWVRLDEPLTPGIHCLAWKPRFFRYLMGTHPKLPELQNPGLDAGGPRPALFGDLAFILFVDLSDLFEELLNTHSNRRWRC